MRKSLKKKIKDKDLKIWLVDLVKIPWSSNVKRDFLIPLFQRGAQRAGCLYFSKEANSLARLFLLYCCSPTGYTFRFFSRYKLK